MIFKLGTACVGLLIVLACFGGMTVLPDGVYGYTIVPAGNVSGTWNNAGSPYYVEGNLGVLGGQKLEIDASAGPVEVRFNGFYELGVAGSLYINGTQANHVTFTSNYSSPAKGNWQRIHIAATGNVQAKWTDVSYATNGFYYTTSVANRLENATIAHCSASGVYATGSINNRIINSHIYDNNEGVRLLSASTGTALINCNISDVATLCVYILSNSGNTVIRNCTMYGDMSWATIRMESHNNIVDHCTLLSGAAGVQGYSSNWNTITNNNVSFNNDGVLFNTNAIPSHNNTVTNNVGYKSGASGGGYGGAVTILGGRNNTVANNSAFAGHYGVRLMSSANNNTIYNNTISGGNYGMDISGPAARFNRVYNNYIRGTAYHGIILDNGDNNTVENNVVAGHATNGILAMTTANGNTIRFNDIEDNAAFGVRINSGDDNLIHHNNFFNNTGHAYDAVGTNLWDNGFPSGGNFWDNYTGIDLNTTAAQNAPPSDGLGDTPYVWLDGGSGTQDLYPLMEPVGGVPPVSAIDAIATYWGNAPIPLSAAATDIGSGVKNVSLWYRRSPDGAAWDAWTPQGTDSAAPWAWAFAFPSGDGRYEFYSVATDNAGYAEAAPTARDRLCGHDTSPPSSSLTSLAAYVHTAGPVQIDGTAADATSGVARLEMHYRFSDDNATWGSWQAFGSDTTAPWSWSFGFPDGSGYYELYSVAIDNATNPEASPSSADVAMLVDTDGPVSGVDALTGTWLNSGPILVNATASDLGGGIFNVTLFYRHSPENSAWSNWTALSGDTSAPYSWAFAFPAGQGYYEFYSVARDALGNVEAAPAIADAKAKFDDVAPATALQQPAQYWRKTGTGLSITTITNETCSGIASLTRWFRHSPDNTTWGNWTDAAGGVFPAGQGYYQYRTTSVDNAGNAEAALATPDALLALDIRAPEIADLSPSEGMPGETLTFSAGVQDDMALAGAWVVYRFGSGNETNATMALANGAYTAAVLLPEGNYTMHYRLAATDKAGNWNGTVESAVDIAEPPAEDTVGEAGFPWWIVIVAVLAAVGLIAFIVFRKKKEKKD